MAVLNFPSGFLWGTAVSSHQVEGNNTNNNWYRWEQEGQTRELSALACDWWSGRWMEDLDRVQETGQNTLRFSVEWSRIQPKPDIWDEEALGKYREMAGEMVKRGIMPMLTLHHFTDPLWFFDMGGWENPSSPELFEKYTHKVVLALRDYVNYWITINEPNIYALSGSVTGDFPANSMGLKSAMLVLRNMCKAHAFAYRAIHEMQPEAHVGYALHYRPIKPARPWFFLDRIMAGIQYRGINMAFPSAIASGIMKTPIGNYKIPEAKNSQDFVGLNYYSVDTVKFDPIKPEQLFARRYYPKGSDLSENGFIANEPEGLLGSIQWAAETFPGVDILITENGVEDSSDSLRPRYLVEHVYSVWKAVNAGFPVKAYYHWSLTDNFEWERGWTQRFGLWHLDPLSQKRTKRHSASIYEKICKGNAIDKGLLKEYSRKPDVTCG